ncbi:MAG TPA: menaquinone biosynthesis protein [Clostridia bacterium]|nr:menaquinone biosynthesis protein [Clostridia bacterium]
MRSLRISAISFLNTAPLMWDFEHEPSPELSNNFEVQYTVPSACARALQEGSADIGIVPVITYAQIPDLVIIPDIAIAAKGPVRSILLISKVPIEQITTVAIDTSSRTSVALTQVLLTNWFGGRREMFPMEPKLGPMLERCDAALLIGDPALMASTTGYYAYDLAEVWSQKTGKPFVFAFWAVRRAALQEMCAQLPLAKIFQRSRDHGLQRENVRTTAEEWSSRLGLSRASIESYLTESIHYYLDEDCTEGMKLYFHYAAECGVIDRVPDFRLL